MDAGNAAPVWVPKSITPHFAALLGEEISGFPVPLGRSEGGSRKPGKGAASLLGVPFPEHLRLAEGEQAFSFCRGGPVPPAGTASLPRVCRDEPPMPLRRRASETGCALLERGISFLAPGLRGFRECRRCPTGLAPFSKARVYSLQSLSPPLPVPFAQVLYTLLSQGVFPQPIHTSTLAPRTESESDSELVSPRVEYLLL